ncbi:MAG: SDR family NAD(P)-dependent oxidoreductase, partial [Pseudomonadota bacterium]|nr:SDR family NAD(P)-dependent oxidoreductase [Pseudomonadota bacterium]
MRLAGKTAIVTGGASGFGAGIVRKFAEEGANVMVADLNMDLARDVAAGRYFLPGAPRGERETIVTSPLNAEPQYLQRMPRPS